MTAPVLERVTGTLFLCSACLDANDDGEIHPECHTPGCVLWCKSAPGVPIRELLELYGCKIEPLPSLPAEPEDDERSER